MRVAIVQEQVDVRRGGAETSTIEMARHLAALGLDVTVVCANRHEGPEARRHAGREGSDEATKRQSDEGLGWPTASAVGDANSSGPNTTQTGATGPLKFHSINVGGGSRVSRAVGFVAQADGFCRAEHFDIVHAVTPCFSCNLYQPRGGTYVETVNRSVARAAGPLSKLVRRIGRRFNRRQRFLLLAERRLLADRNPPFVAAVSAYVARQVRAAFPQFPTDRLRVVFNGVDIEPWSAEEARTWRAAVRRDIGIDEATPLVLFVAHNFKLKGLGELIRALAVLSHSSRSPALERAGHPQSEPGARATGQDSDEATKRRSDEATKRRSDEAAARSNCALAVAGRDSPAPYSRLARRLRVDDRVRFLGTRDDIRSLYAAADLLAHPTWYDPCSRVVLEALSCGLPVVTTRFNGAADVIEEGKHGVVIDSPRDAAALASAISRCLEPELREACAAGAPQMRDHLSMARHARELKSLYEEAAAAKI
jgi:UDP-glucose:(heptosyl)LPS alpha-1,3-glucosyltransferase